MIKKYLNEQKPSDKEVFYKIQYYHHKKNMKSKNKQWALLNKSKPKDLKQLLKNSDFTKAFNDLVDM